MGPILSRLLLGQNVVDRPECQASLGRGHVLAPAIELEDVAANPEIESSGAYAVRDLELCLDPSQPELFEYVAGESLANRLSACIRQGDGFPCQPTVGPVPHVVEDLPEFIDGHPHPSSRVDGDDPVRAAVLARDVDRGAREAEDLEPVRSDHLIIEIRREVVLHAPLVVAADDRLTSDVGLRLPGEEDAHVELERSGVMAPYERDGDGRARGSVEETLSLGGQSDALYVSTFGVYAPAHDRPLSVTDVAVDRVEVEA
ncbi:hypothetical protein OG984_18645 [Nocardioides sp. NBC_00368]|uniref:hypothetical protein n=1 Tax=Nocardioides sp. NBC_00368 TaxID=2976000 RepID=UPI002E202C4E